MTFYMICQFYTPPMKQEYLGWYPLDLGPWTYLAMKDKMRELKRENPGNKYKLLKTSY